MSKVSDRLREWRHRKGISKKYISKYGGICISQGKYQSEYQCKYRLQYRKKLKKIGLSRNRGNRTKQFQIFRDKFPEKRQAHQAVYRALQTGILKKPLHCPICGNGKFIMAHHKDYSKWLDIKWLCYKCHNKIHNGGGEIKNDKTN